MNTLAEKFPKLTDIHQLNSWLPALFNTLLIIACSYTLAQITWLLIPQPVQTQPIQSQPARLVRPAIKQMQFAQQISQNRLFGNYQAAQAPQKIQADAPETRLNLVLKGALASTPMSKASAIIAMGKNGVEDIYGIDDRVSSATIKEIHTDRVILERSGQYETLRLPKEFSDNTLINIEQPQGGTTQADETTSLPSLGEIRDNILRNPASFTQYAIPVPYRENGKLRGYKLQPRGNSQLFDSLGLVTGDVVVSVNEIPLDDPKRSLDALRALQNNNQVTLSVLRNGEEIPLHLEIP